MAFGLFAFQYEMLQQLDSELSELFSITLL
jgi:hypothetical protein